MTWDDDRIPDHDGMFFFIDRLDPKTEEAFAILLAECQSQAARKYLQQQQVAVAERNRTRRPAKAQLKLVQSKERA